MGFDRIGRPTGLGKITNELHKQAPDVVCDYVLYNYNIDGNVLKQEHISFLRREIVPLLRENELHAELVGMASRSGDREYNRQLSIGRVLRVKEFLRGEGLPESKLPGPDVHAVGEDLSTSALQEDEYDRAVRIRIKLGIKPFPILPNIVVPIIITNGPPNVINLPPVDIPRPRAESESWTIRQIIGHNIGVGVGPLLVGVGAGAVHYTFLLVNRRTGQQATCAFNGLQGSAGPGPTINGSMVMQSRVWNNFSTKKGKDFTDFNGRAAWHEPLPGIGGKPTLELPDLNVIVGVDTGTTVGLPSTSVSFGQFSCRTPVGGHR